MSDKETTKRAYLVKLSGSMGCVYDFSNVHIYSECELQAKCKEFGAKSFTIKHAYYDKRIHLNKWYVLDEAGRALFWILSPTRKTPILSEWNELDEGM